MTDIIEDTGTVTVAGLGTDSACRERRIRRRPAMDDIRRAMNDFIRSAMHRPHQIVMGFETYINFCIDYTEMQNPQPVVDIVRNGGILRPTEWQGCDLVVNHEVAWQVLCTYRPTESWPSYGQDDETEELHIGNETS